MAKRIARQRVDRTSPEALGGLISKHLEHRMHAFQLTERARDAYQNVTPEEQAKIYAAYRRALDNKHLDRLVARGLYQDREEALKGEVERFRRERRAVAWAKAGVKSRKKCQELAATDFGAEALAQLKAQEEVEGQIQALPSEGWLLSGGQIQALEMERLEVLSGGPSKADFELYQTKRFIPEFNKLSPLIRLCPQCWQKFAVTHGNADCCSDSCAMKARNIRRGEKNRAAGKELEANIRGERSRHEASCFICRGGGKCSGWQTFEEQIRGDKPQSVRMSTLVSLELAEKKRAR